MNNISISELEVPFSMLYLARRNTGKSVLAQHVTNKLLESKKLDVVYIFSKTCKLNDNWLTIPDKYKCEDMDYKKINKIIDTQMKHTKAKSKKLKQVCLIFDDVIDSGGAKNELKDLFNDIFSRGRHFKISIMLLNQYVKNIVTPPHRGPANAGEGCT